MLSKMLFATKKFVRHTEEQVNMSHTQKIKKGSQQKMTFIDLVEKDLKSDITNISKDGKETVSK